MPVVVGTREPEALRAIRSSARRRRAKAIFIDRDFSALPEAEGASLYVQTEGREIGPFSLALCGDHQRDNATCAVAALVRLRSLGFRIPDAAVRRGLSRVRWPARLERIAGSPELLLDAAHNPDGSAALAQHLGALPARVRGKTRRARRVLLFGVMSDKDYPAMLRILGPLFDHVVYAPKLMARAASVRELRRVQPGSAARSVEAALARAKKLAGPKGLVVIAGSIFVVAQARALLLRLPSDPLIRM
jgi:dihydrofolate synthase/folylpolyglutamate synthase